MLFAAEWKSIDREFSTSRRDDTHAVQLTPHKRSAVWWKLPQIPPCNRHLILRHRPGRSLEDDVAARRTAAGTELDEPVAGLQNLDVVLDEEDGVARLHHRVEKVEDTADVARVKTVGGLVHDEDK